VRYVSTRGSASPLDFEGVMLSGLARDGGLYVPERWPHLDFATLKKLRGQPYTEVAAAVVAPFIGDFVSGSELDRLIGDAYRCFRHPCVAPLSQLDHRHWLLELFHGPTLAFKDVALQLLSRLMDRSLARRGRRAAVVCATSGDTGSAAIEAFRTSSRVVVFVLHPHRRVSPVQRLQMTTVHSANVHNIALEGTFDDCQSLVKRMFADGEFRDRVGLAAVNSINWARIAAQVVYYVTAALALGAPERPVSFAVPTGNFGNVYSGYVAKRIGVPIGRLIIACNVNDILHRALTGGRYEVHAVTPSLSPSMDIQISSNFERLLFDAARRDPQQVIEAASELSQSSCFTIAPATLAAIRSDFLSGRADEDCTRRTIAAQFAESGRLIDPHTAVGLAVARRHARISDGIVTLATAHPAKFPEVVEQAAGVSPQLPARLSQLYEKEEKFTILPNHLKTVQDHILSRI
jgi:threonine synthase